MLVFFNTDHTKLLPHKFLKFHAAQIFDVSYILLPLSIFFRYITNSQNDLHSYGLVVRFNGIPLYYEGYAKGSEGLGN